MRVVVEATNSGLEQYAAIAYHNLGVMLRYAGQLDDSVTYLERAAKYWDASPANPFADDSEFVQVLLLRGEVKRAAAIAESAIARTKFWPKPSAEAIYGMACVLVHRGQLGQAIESLRKLLVERRQNMGSALAKITALQIECLYLDGSGSEEMSDLLADLQSQPRDPRLAPITSIAVALAAHRVGSCAGQCVVAREELLRWEKNGSPMIALLGGIPLGLLAIEHRSSATALRRLVDMTIAVIEQGVAQHMRWWLRRLSPYAAAMIRTARDPAFLVGLVATDPEHWIPTAAGVLPSLKSDDRKAVLGAIEQAADRTTHAVLRRVDGADAQELRKRLVNRFADPIYIRSFGPMLLHNGAWTSPRRLVPKKRMRLLLGLLVASFESGMTREQVLDTLWPDSDPAAGVNSLNQTVFQLRRLFDESYREGDSPQYIHSNAEIVQLNAELVTTDLSEFHAIGRLFKKPMDRGTRADLAESLVELVRGEFLSDVKYEDWATSAQMRVHAAIREQLLPIARGEFAEVSSEVALRAGHALTIFDPFDEQAHLAIAQVLAGSGRRAQARDVLHRYTQRMRTEFDEEPSEDVRLAASLMGTDVGQVSVD
jgi:DNA-binding SARP family transcriptional activator